MGRRRTMKAPDTYWTGKDPLGTHKKPFAEEVDEYYEHLHKKRKHCKHMQHKGGY